MHPALASAAPEVLWLTDPDRPTALPPLTRDSTADLVVVGGGYTGLWTALRARERYPDLDVLLLDGGTCGWQASGRNGGFADSSLTHGYGNGIARWPDELAELDRLGEENLTAIEETIARYDIDCRFERTGGLDVATAPHQVDELRELVEDRQAAGHDVSFLEADEVRARVDSPTYLGAQHDPHGIALVEPARLAWGLRAACYDLGVRIHEHTRATGLAEDGAGVVVTTAAWCARAGRTGGAGDQRLHAAAAAAAADDGAGLRLRAGHRAALGRRNAPRSAGRAARASATPPTCSTTTGSPATTGSSGVGTTRSTATGRRSIPSTSSRDAPTTCWPRSSSRRSPSSRDCPSRTAGPA